MITVCSRCKDTISETFQEGSESKVSHGICSRCLAILEGEIREGEKAVSRSPEEKTEPLPAEDP